MASCTNRRTDFPIFQKKYCIGPILIFLGVSFVIPAHKLLPKVSSGPRSETVSRPWGSFSIVVYCFVKMVTLMLTDWMRNSKLGRGDAI